MFCAHPSRWISGAPKSSYCIRTPRPFWPELSIRIDVPKKYQEAPNALYRYAVKLEISHNRFAKMSRSVQSIILSYCDVRNQIEKVDIPISASIESRIAKSIISAYIDAGDIPYLTRLKSRSARSTILAYRGARGRKSGHFRFR